MFKVKLTKTAAILISLLVSVSAAQALTDPTRPAQYRASTKSQSLNLESILFSDSRRVVVINGKVLAEGENIGSARVLSISNDTVRLQRNGEMIRLMLQRPTIRQEK